MGKYDEANKRAQAVAGLTDQQKQDLAEAFELFDTDGSGNLQPLAPYPDPFHLTRVSFVRLH